MSAGPIAPPFDEGAALAIVQAFEEAWNRRIAEEIPQTCTPDTRWRYRDAFVEGRDNIVPFLRARWPVQEHYRLKKELWSFTANRISVRFISEWRHRDTGHSATSTGSSRPTGCRTCSISPPTISRSTRPSGVSSPEF